MSKALSKTHYLDQLRTSLNAIFEDYKTEKPELTYKIVPFGEKQSVPIEKANTPLMSHEEALNYSSHNRDFYFKNKDYSLVSTVTNYHITNHNNIKNPRNVLTGHHPQFEDTSTTNIFNFNQCNIDLQGHLNDLAGELEKETNADKETVKELKDMASALETVEDVEESKAVKKLGVANKLKRFMGNLENKDSKLHKSIKSTKKYVGIAQDIAKSYNDIAQWVGLPQVPKPFLKNKPKFVIINYELGKLK